MAGSNNRQLFLQVGADVSPLTSQMKVGRTALLALGDAAGDVQAEINKALAAVAADPNTLKQVEASYRATFDNIRRNAQAALAVNDNASALKLIDATGAQQAAAAAQSQAVQFRLAADAAAMVAQREGEAGLAARALAAALEVQAIDAAKVATALSAQAGVMTEVAAEARILGAREDEVSGSHARMGASGMIAEHVVRSLSDSIAAGQSPVRALGMEMGRITEAMTMFAQTTDAQGTGAMARFASFMGGPWGLAVSVGVAVLVPLVAELLGAGKAADEAAKATKDHKDAIDSLVEAEGKAVMTGNEKLRQDAIALENERLLAIATRERTAALLENALAQARANREAMAAEQQHGTRDTNTFAGAQLDSQVVGLQAQLAANKAEVARLGTAATQATGRYVGAAIKEQSTPEGRIKAKYETLDRAAERDLERTKDYAKYGDTLRRLDAAQQAEVKALAEKRAADARTKRDDRQFGNTISTDAAAAIVRGIGGQVNSGTRTYSQQKALYDSWVAQGKPAGNPVAVPGTSAHERGNALDVQMTSGMSIAKIKEAFAAEGVALTKAIVERGHYHVEWGKKGPSDETLQRRQEAEQTKAANNDRGYQGELGAAQERIKRANMTLADTIEQKAISESFGVENARALRNIEIDDEVKANKISAARGAILKGLNDRGAGLDQAEIRKKLDDAQADRALTIQKDGLDTEIEQLRLRSDLALTTAERADLARQILDREQQEAAAVLRAKIAKEDDPDLKAADQKQLDALPATYALKRQQSDRQNADPMKSYMLGLHKNTDDVNEALKGVEVTGVKGLEDGLLGVVSGTESLGSAFRKMADSIISDLARIAVEKLIVKIIGGGIFADGIVPGHADGIIPGFAAGIVDGVIRGPGTGRSDSIFGLMGGKPIMVSNGESIMTEQATRRYGSTLKAMNDNRFPRFATGMVPDSAIYMSSMPSAHSIAQPASPPQIVYMTVDKSGLFDVHVQRAAAPLAQAAVVGGSALAQQEIGENQSRQIPV